jgi:hypothetical protein
MLWQDVQIANRNPTRDILMSKNDIGEQERLLPCFIRLVDVDKLVELHKRLA